MTGTIDVNAFLRRAAAVDDVGALVAGLCEDLTAAGLPIWRASASFQVLDPVLRARSTIWWREHGLTHERTTHATGPGQFQRSPIRAVADSGQGWGRWRLLEDEIRAFPLLVELREQGAVDYVMHLIAFDTTRLALPGVAVSFCTDAPAGFTPGEIDVLAGIVPAVALASARAALAEIARNVLEVYLGPSTAAHVLKGEIRRGLGRRIEAAILLADLRGFTSLTERSDPLAVVGWLDEHLDRIAQAVAARGGEVLKFLGDGLLAVFQGEGDAPCASALDAALVALAANDALNGARARAGAPTLALDVALHHGEVVYGNVGSQGRLDFTVIGRAVNEASRIEALCATLDRPILLSGTFARRCGRPTVDLGRHALRGLAEPREIHAPA